MSHTRDSTSAINSDAGTWLSRFRNKNPFQSSYWTLYTITDDIESRLLLGLGLVSAIAAGIPLPLIAVTFKSIVESFPPDEDSLNRAIFRIVGISFAYFVVTFAWSVSWGELGRRISQKLQTRLVEKVLGLDQTFFDVDPVDITSILVSDTQTIQRGTSEKVGLFVQSCSYFIATFITGFILNAALTGVLFAAIVPAIIIITWTGSSFVSKYSLKAAELTEKATSVAEGAIHCVLVVQAFGIANTLSDKHVQLLKAATRYAIRKVIVSAVMLATVFWSCYCLMALAFYWGSRLGGSSGTIYAVVFLVLDASFVFNQVGPFIQTIALAAGAASKVFSLLNRVESEIHIYAKTGVQVSYHDVLRDITFESVDFCYPVRAEVKVLNSLHLTIPGGRSTALVGLSGSGKSTLAGLVLRSYDPNSGRVTVGSHDIRNLHLATFRSQIAIVQQNPVIFSGTIFDNIKCGIVNANDLGQEEVRARCRKAAEDAHCDFVEELPDGMDTIVSGSQGLSGGQRQRICLARALARKPALLVLDEPTSALDSWSERKIEESLKKVMEEGITTVITIAHRLATIKDYSNIVVMGDGRVLEQGTHEELLTTGHHYRALVEAQQLEQSLDDDSEASKGFSDLSADSTPILSSTETSLEKIASPYSQTTPQTNVQETVPDRKITNGHILKRCYQYLRPERALLSVGILAALIQGCVVVGESIVFGHLIEILNTPSDRETLYHRIDFYCLIFFVISLITFTASTLNGICFGFVSEAFMLRMRDVLLRTILVQDQSWFQEPEHTSTKLMAGINQNANSIGALSGPILQSLFATSAMIVSGMILALVSTPLITIVTMSYIPAILLSGYVRVKMLTLFDQRYASANKHAASIACEAVQNIQTVAAFGLEFDILQRYYTAIRSSYWSNFTVMAIGDLALSFSYSIIYFLYPLLYWWGARQVRDGKYSQQQFFTTMPAIVIASQQCGQFFTMAPEITSARLAARQVFRLLQNQPTITQARNAGKNLSPEKVMDVIEPVVPLSLKVDQAEKHLSKVFEPDQPLPAPMNTVPTGGAGIEFRNVSFAYPMRPDTKILHGINLRIQPGQFVAFVGPSGAGKSSLVAMLERFHDPSGGKVLVDGKDIRQTPVELHRSQIGLVPQEPELFAGSVSFNLSLGVQSNKAATQEEIESVCKACGIHEFISSLPEGYDTECGNKGSKLSGGQKQRIAVARALIRNPRILLLDEATAALDSHSEKDIQEAVSAASADRTTIVIAHRLSTIQNVDCIFVFDNGVLVDQGTHTELIKKEGIYSTMVEAQALS